MGSMTLYWKTWGKISIRKQFKKHLMTLYDTKNPVLMLLMTLYYTREAFYFFESLKNLEIISFRHNLSESLGF